MANDRKRGIDENEKEEIGRSTDETASNAAEDFDEDDEFDEDDDESAEDEV
jgi:hypothetical protein